VLTELRFAAIADDFTGATDLAGMLVRGGLRTVQVIGKRGLLTLRRGDTEAIVVALKTRSVDAAIAVHDSLEATDGLRRLGASTIYFKYCSTFDSTPAGNIGPVAEALQEHLKAPFVPFAPAFPENGRRVFRGHLFVADALLNESGMQAHPLNPMRDANLVRVLAAQSKARVGLITHDIIRSGVPEVIKALSTSATDGKPLVVLDSIDDENLETIAEAVLDAPLVTGGSALGFHMARKLAAARPVIADECSEADRLFGDLSPRPGRCAVLAGSCSRRTLEQVAYFRERWPSVRVPVERLMRGENVGAEVIGWFAAQSSDTPLLIYTSAAPDALTTGRDCADEVSIGRRIEAVFAAIAQELIAQNVSSLIIAGGETSGAVVAGLGISALKIGPEIVPGVPWTQVIGAGPAAGVCLALKSGNFGPPEFFIRAFERLNIIENAL
jgi:uncharacterized protein YgbK (DUF1537 family)